MRAASSTEVTVDSGGPPELDEYRHVRRMRLEHAVPVREPLVLVSQIQRSGGTLLSQLFDGHPECHAHPQELHIGYPNKRIWPRLDPADREEAFEILRERLVRSQLRKGYRKENAARERFPFLFLPTLQEELFTRCVSAQPVETERELLDCYFTSYFNAWLDNQNLYSGPKRVVTAFVARLALNRESVEHFFAAYPDGALISIVRDPRDWFASARLHHKRFADLDRALGWWRRSARAALAASGRHGDRVVVLAYERLVGDTEATMSEVAHRLGISMSDRLLVPTFNGRPIQANSSFGVAGYGVRPERAGSFRDALEPAEIARIEELAGDLYERATAL